MNLYAFKVISRDFICLLFSFSLSFPMVSAFEKKKKKTKQIIVLYEKRKNKICTIMIIYYWKKKTSRLLLVKLSFNDTTIRNILYTYIIYTTLKVNTNIVFVFLWFFIIYIFFLLFIFGVSLRHVGRIILHF